MEVESRNLIIHKPSDALCGIWRLFFSPCQQSSDCSSVVRDMYVSK